MIKTEVIIPDNQEWTDGTLQYSGNLCWFTDGSLTDNGAEAEAYGETPSKFISVRLGRYTTMFQVEIFAIMECVQCLLRAEY